MQFEGKIYKIGLEWIGLEKSNGTITISIHFQNCNGYPVHSWTGWTDWTDQSKAGLVTNTLVIVIMRLVSMASIPKARLEHKKQ